MDDPQPIETAPKDGRVILTDEGFARYINKSQWAPPVRNKSWALCYPCGSLIEDSDDGIEYCQPKLWVPKPDWCDG